ESPASAVRTRLALRADVAGVRARVLADVTDSKTPRPLLLDRLTALEEFGIESSATAVPPLLNSPSPDVAARALAGLPRVGGRGAGDAILAAYPALPAALKPRAREVLFGRAAWAAAFIARVDAGTIPAAEVPVEQVRLLALLGDKGIDAAVRKHWG